jgi:rhodanese-related sulfurtransferase
MAKHHWMAAAAAVTAAFACAQQQSVPTVSPAEVFRRLQDTSVLLVDVRTPAEFATGFIQGARLLPLQELARRLHELEPYRHKTIIAYCRSGNRSARATQLLQQHGFRVFNMSGGILEWQQRGYPLVTPREPTPQQKP